MDDDKRVEPAILVWENNVKKYHDTLPLASAERLSEQRQIRALQRLLPHHHQRNAAIHHPAEWRSVRELKDWVLDQIRQTQHLPGKRAMMLELLDDEDDDETRAEVLALSEDATDAQINAVQNRRFVRRNAQGRSSKGGGKKGGHSKGDGKQSRCANCLSTDHISRDCQKPKLDIKDQPCFK